MLGKKLRRYLIALGVGVLALAAVPAAGFGQADGYQNLEPGERAELDEKVPVNFVFVGYERNDVNADKFLAGLPDRYKPIVRSRYSYNKSIGKSLLGLNYTYDYNVKFAGGDYEKKVFRFLSDAAKPAPLTDYQKLYNGNSRSFCNPPEGDPQPCQKGGVRDIEKNYHISAPAVERWLAENPPAGVDTKRNTVFFINWWGDGTAAARGLQAPRLHQDQRA